jgi:uncharacterized repeat protein (TIGR01451 family)
MQQKFVHVVRQLKWWTLSFFCAMLVVPTTVSADSPSFLASMAGHIPAFSGTPLVLDKRSHDPVDNPPAVLLTIDDAIEEGKAALPGQSITYTFVFTNVGDMPVTKVRLVAVVPAHTQLTNTAASGWSCTPVASHSSHSPCAIEWPQLAAQASGTAQLIVVVDNPLPETVHTIVLEASVNADEVVCGECGYATITTPVDPDQNQLPSFNLYLPNLARRAS